MSEIRDWLRDEADERSKALHNARRYEIVKDLNPRQFSIIYGMCMKGRKFDDLIDEAYKQTIELHPEDNTLTNLEVWGVPNEDKIKIIEEETLPTAV